MDIKAIAEGAAKSAAEKVDESIPDGMIQSFAGRFIEEFGLAMAAAGKELRTTQNEDGDA